MEDKYYITIELKNKSIHKIVENVILGAPQFTFPETKALTNLQIATDMTLEVDKWARNNNLDIKIRIKEYTPTKKS